MIYFHTTKGQGMRKLALRICFLSLLTFTVLSCKDEPKGEIDGGDSDQSTSTISPVEPEEPVTPPPVSKADLRVSNLKIEKVVEAGGNKMHYVSVVITNHGETEARGFDCGFTYKCPAGLVLSSGNDLVQGGYLGPNASRTYGARIKISCDPIPAFLDISLDPDFNDDVDESNEQNNMLKTRLTIPL